MLGLKLNHVSKRGHWSYKLERYHSFKISIFSFADSPQRSRERAKLTMNGHVVPISPGPKELHVIKQYAGEILFLLFKCGEGILDTVVRIHIYKCVHRLVTEHYLATGQPMGLELEHTVQSRAALFIVLHELLLFSPAIFLGMSCGSWSDAVGRKTPVMVGCLGTALAMLLYFSSCIFGELAIVFTLLGSGIRGIFGTSTVVTMALHSYVADVSSQEARTSRMGSLLAMNYIGLATGSLLGGVLMDLNGIGGVFCLVASLNATYTILAILIMAETPERRKDKELPKIKSPLSLSHLVDSFRFITRSRPGNRRNVLIAMFVLVFLHQALKSGEIDVLVLYTQRAPFYWDNGMFGYSQATHYGSYAIGVIVGLPVLTRLFKASDMALILAASLFRLFNTIILSFASSSWMVYASYIVAFPSGYIAPVCKSVVSKTVDKDETGKAFALLSCGVTISKMAGSMFLTAVYHITRRSHPGIAYVTASGVFGAWILVVIILISDKTDRKRSLNDEERTPLQPKTELNDESDH